MERLIVLYLVVQVSALLGALAWSWPTDRLGPKRVVMITLGDPGLPGRGYFLAPAAVARVSERSAAVSR